MKILVVDDEKFNLVIAKDLLASLGDNHEVILCSDPETVMDTLSVQSVGVVLLDIIMPKMDGIAVLKQIRQHNIYDDVQIVMFTGVSDQISFRLCFENGANDYINKPINPTEFTVRMQAAIKARNNLLKLKQAQEYLIHAEKLTSLGELAAGVAHEINNPMGFVSSNLETLGKYLTRLRECIKEYRELGQKIADLAVSRETLIATQRQIVANEQQSKIDRVLSDVVPLIEESCDGVGRVNKIVMSLRNFARSGQEDEVLPNDLNQIVEDALMILKNEIKYIANVEKDLNPLLMVECDKGQMAQVLVNILHNAVQAIQQQKRTELGTIWIHTYMEGAFAVCRIADNGPGIKQEYLNRIFDPFFTTKEVGSGSGLGLSIAYGIAKKFAGDLSVENQQSGGAAFLVKLPSVKRGG
jgi:C4-dicarboxylate-specific signal transduction histidine kinase